MLAMSGFVGHGGRDSGPDSLALDQSHLMAQVRSQGHLQALVKFLGCGELSEASGNIGVSCMATELSLPVCSFLRRIRHMTGQLLSAICPQL
jgi:hypothetical protein